MYGYFSKAIELRNQFDVHKALADQGIVPGSTPNVNDMHNAVQKAFGADAQFNCNNGQLSEVRNRVVVDVLVCFSSCC